MVATVKVKATIGKFFLSTFGKILPLKRHPGGHIANWLRCLFAKMIVDEMGKGCNVESGAEIMEHCKIGDHTGIGPRAVIGAGTVFKGNSMMGPDVHIYTNAHRYDEEKHCFDGYTEMRPVIIGANTWIGYGVIILPGVEIGDNSIIGAGSVVTKSIPAGVMAAGNPCVVKKVIDPSIFAASESVHA